MIKPVTLAVLALCATLGGSVAAPFCIGDRPGVSLEFGMRIGDAYTQEERNEFDLMRLRQMGVDATRVERWNGCIRAFVRRASGVGEEMQFFDPNTFRRVE